MNHPREKQSACKICDRKFVQLSHLRRHEKIHNGKDIIKPFTCEICGKSFARLEHLKRHEMLHTGERPFQCKYCSKKFTRQEHLKDHEKSHTGEKIECKYCDMKFTLPDSLRQHEKRHITQIEKVKRENSEGICDITSDNFKSRLFLSKSNGFQKSHVVSENLEPEMITENDSQEKVLPEVISVSYDNVEDDEILKGILVLDQDQTLV